MKYNKEAEEANKVKAMACLRRFKAAKNKRANWDEHWRDVARYVIPTKENVHDWKSRSKGDKKNLRLYDSSARHYNELLASALHSMLTNPSVQWFELTTGDRELDKNQKVKKYLQETVRKIHQVLNNTNFQTEIHELYLDLGSFGTGAMLIDTHPDNIINFMSRPIYQFYVEENHYKQIDTFFIEIPYTGRQIKQKYGEERLTDKMQREFEKDPNKEHNVVMMVKPNEDFDSEKKLDEKSNKPWKSLHVFEKEKAILRESGFDEFPGVFPRWIKDSMETYGRSPAMKSLPEIKMINAMMRTVIRGGQKIVDPSLAVPDDGFIQVNTRPGGLTTYRSGTNDKIYPIESGGRVDIGIELLREIREQIKQAFYIDQLQLRDGPQMTATEVNARTDEHLRLLGPILGRLHHELLQPMIARIIGIMKRAGELPDNPPQELEGKAPQVYYSSQIARAQRIAEGQNWNRYLGSISALAEGMPEIMDNLDPDKVDSYLSDIYGAPQDVKREPTEVKKLRQSRQEAQQAERQAMMEQEQAKTMETTAKASNARS